MIGIFKQKSPANIILLFVFGVLLKLPMFLHPHITLEKPGDGLLYRQILRFLHSFSLSSSILFPIIAFTFLYIQAMMLTRFIAMQRMMSRSTYFPGMAYLLITSLLPEWNYFSAPLLVNTILLFALSALFRIYNQPKAKGTIFNVGLALGVASFLFSPSLAFVLWILLALMVMRPFRLNEWLLCILGIITPFYFYSVYLFITDAWSWQNIKPFLVVRFPSLQQSIWLAGSFSLLTIPFLIGGYQIQFNLRKMLIHVRKGWSLLLLYLLVALIIPFVNNEDASFVNWVMAAIPFATFHACTYHYSSLRIVPFLLFWLSIAFVLSYQYLGPGW